MKQDKKTITVIICVISILTALIVVLAANFLKSSSGAQNGKMGGMPGGAPAAVSKPAPANEKSASGEKAGQKTDTQKSDQKSAAQNFNQTANPVKTVVAKNTTLTAYVNTNGDVESQRAIEVFPSMSGTVIDVKVSLGSPVKKGDILAYVDPSEPGSYYAKSPVTAPISGSIISTPLKTGQKVTLNSVITQIGDIDNLQVTAKIPERYVAQLSLGQKAEISLEAYPGVVFDATVVRISPVLDASTRTKEIILYFEKADSRINAGMYAKVKLYTIDYSGYPVIQQDAVVNNNDENFVYVVNEDGETVTKRKVTLGQNIGGYYQLLSGVFEGEKMVVEGMLVLSEGSKIIDITNK